VYLLPDFPNWADSVALVFLRFPHYPHHQPHPLRFERWFCSSEHGAGMLADHGSRVDYLPALVVSQLHLQPCNLNRLQETKGAVRGVDEYGTRPRRGHYRTWAIFISYSKVLPTKLVIFHLYGFSQNLRAFRRLQRAGVASDVAALSTTGRRVALSVWSWSGLLKQHDGFSYLKSSCPPDE
jgi:hypothetical protein